MSERTTDCPEKEELLQLDFMQELPLPYREAIADSYRQAHRISTNAIVDETMGSAYRLSSLGYFAEPLAELEVAYRAFGGLKTYADGVLELKPVPLFVPNALPEGRWHTLLSGHQLDDGYRSNGLWDRWKDAESEVTTIANQQELWYPAIITNVDRVMMTTMTTFSADPEKRKIKDTNSFHNLCSLLGAKAYYWSEEAQYRLSPNEQEYCALQLSRLAAGQTPADEQNWTFGQERANVGGQVKTVYYQWDGMHHEVSSNVRDLSADVERMRPIVRPGDLAVMRAFEGEQTR